MWTTGREARITLVELSETSQACDVPPPTEEKPQTWLKGASVLVLLLLGNVIVFSLAAYGLYDLVRN